MRSYATCACFEEIKSWSLRFKVLYVRIHNVSTNALLAWAYSVRDIVLFSELAYWKLWICYISVFVLGLISILYYDVEF